MSALLILPAPLCAQTDRESHFGVIVSFSPESKANKQLKFIHDNPDAIDVKSRDFEIGFIVRGRPLGGDWGVSYVQKKYKEGSVIDRRSEFCLPECLAFGALDIMQDVQMRGLAIHKFAPFVTIKRRAQIGLGFGGGVAWVKGTAERHEFDSEFSPPNRFVQTEAVTEIDAKLLFVEDLDPMPIWKVELAGAVLLAPGLKVRVGGGLNFTNYPAFSISAVYLIGAK
jgi:hypothetical protein